LVSRLSISSPSSSAFSTFTELILLQQVGFELLIEMVGLKNLYQLTQLLRIQHLQSLTFNNWWGRRLLIDLVGFQTLYQLTQLFRISIID
jgi:hypothetical protein